MASEKGTTNFLQETLIPLLSGIIDLGQPGQRWRTIWTQGIDASGVVTISRTPTSATDAANKSYVDLTSGPTIARIEEVDGVPSITNPDKLAFDQADGFVVSNPAGSNVRVDLSGVPTSVLAGPITAAKGGTNIDTSASTGVPVVDAGTWTVPATLAVSKGGTGQSSTGAGYVKGGNPMALQATPLPAADLGTGATSSKFLRGDQTWQQSPALSQAFRNLHIRTHPDNDKTANQVALLNLDEVLMDEGSRYLSPVVAGTDAPLTADITVAGAGGLDTGTRVASTGYETYLIGKSSTQAKADLRLILHRAKDYFPDQSFTTDDAGRGLRLLTAPLTDKLAQGFQQGTAGKIEFVDIKIVRQGAVSGNVWVTIETDSAGNPSGVVQATSDKLDAAKISTTAGFIRIPFRTPFNASAATQYHLVLQADYAKSDTIILIWRGAAAGGYPNGAAKEFNGTAWNATTGLLDFDFKTYTTRNDTAVTMPAGYDQKALLAPWFFNNSGNTLDAAKVINRWVVPIKTAVSLGAIATNVPTLTDASTYLPPRPVSIAFHVQNNTAGSNDWVAGVPEGFGGTLANTDAAAQTVTVPGISYDAALPARILTEFQSVYLYNSGTGNYFIRGWEW